MKINHRLSTIFFSIILLLEGLQCLGQQKIKGTYSHMELFTGYSLTIKSNHSFILTVCNWESWNGFINYGKWILKNDTLYLNYAYSKRVSGIKNGGIKVHAFKTKIIKTDTLLVSNNFLCKKLLVNESCYKKRIRNLLKK